MSYEFEQRESFSWEADGWMAEFSAIPIGAEHRGRSDHRPIGVYADGDVDFVDDAPSLQSALGSKATAYGQLDRPLLLAVGTYIWDHERWHSTNALYGHAAVTWRDDGDGNVRTEPSRSADGFFGTPEQWLRREVAGVLHVNQLQPHHAHRAELTLWPHPAHAHVVDGLAARLPAVTVKPVEGALVSYDPQVDATTFLELTEPWPTGEAFPSRVTEQRDRDPTATPGASLDE